MNSGFKLIMNFNVNNFVDSDKSKLQLGVYIV